MKNLICAVAAAACGSVFADGVSLTSGDYIQTGLMVQFDAIDNEAVGTHNDALETWNDLKGGTEVSLTDYAWTANGLKFTSDTGRGIGGRQKFNNQARTLETFVTQPESSNRFYVGWTRAAGDSNRPGLWVSGAPATTYSVTLFNNSDQTFGTQVAGVNYFAAVYDTSLAANTRGVYLNGEFNAINLGSPATGNTSNRLRINAYGANGDTDSYYGGTAVTYHAFRVYSRGLSEQETAYNRAVDRVRFEGVDPATAFAGVTGNYRWNATTGRPEALLSAEVLEGAGTFTINGSSGDVWVEMGATATVVYTPAEGEVALSWTGYPLGGTISDDICTNTFTVGASYALQLQLRTVFDDVGSLIADGGFENGGGYIYDGGHQYGWLNHWSRSGDRCSVGNTSYTPENGFAYLNVYQANSASQSGVVIPAGDYILSFDYKWGGQPFDAYVKVTDSSNVSRTLASIVTDLQRDGTGWHTVQVKVTFDHDDLYTFRTGASQGGNNTVHIDNVILKCDSDLRIDPIADQPYLGEQVKPSFIVRDTAGNVLTEEVDYELKWGRNNSAGVGYVAAVAKGTHYGVFGANFVIGQPIYVTPEGLSDASGSSWAEAVDFATAVQKAAARTAPTEVWVAGSNVLAAAAVLRRFGGLTRFRGGFAGTESSPDERAPGAVSFVDGQGLYNAVLWKGFHDVSFERLHFRNSTTFALSKTSYQGGITLLGCVFENNGVAGSGGGVSFTSTDARRKLSAKDCRFLGNASAGKFSYGNGAAVQVAVGPAEFTGCEFTGFLGNNTGSIVYLAGAGSGSRFDRCLFHADSGLRSAVLIERDAVARTVDFDFCTFANLAGCSSAYGAAIHASKGTLKVRNSIFHGNSNGASSIGADITSSANAPCDLDYVMLDGDDAMHLVLGSSESEKGSHITAGDPLFVADDDVHVLSEAGYFDNAGNFAYADEDVYSPAIDAGEPTASFALEPEPNGGRVNLGYYGGTAEASCSYFGSDTPTDYPHLTIKKLGTITAVGCTLKYRIDFADPVDLYICCGEAAGDYTRTNVIESAARIGTVKLTGLAGGVDYKVKLYAKAADGRDGDTEPEYFTTIAISSANYVSDGLVMQLDGFDNAGRGLHDESSPVWQDLVGNCHLFLNEHGAFSNSWLQVDGLSAVATNKAPSYRTIEVLQRMTSPSGGVLFNSALDNNYHMVIFTDSGTRCAFTRIWYQNGDGYLPLTYLSTLDRCITATYRPNTTIDSVFINGTKATRGHAAGAFNGGNGSMATIGAYGDGSLPWYGRVYALRLYNRTLTDEEIALNGAVDLVRYQEADPELAFTGDVRWNSELRRIEARLALAVDGAEGSFTINGVRTNETWLAIGDQVDILYTPEIIEQRPLEWHGLPNSAVISNGLCCAGFRVTSAVNATLQIERAGGMDTSLIADGGYEEGNCYVHPNGYGNQVWIHGGAGGSSPVKPNTAPQQSFIARPYQGSASDSQPGLIIPAGEYILSYQYKCDTSGTSAAFGITDTNGVETTLATIQSDSQRDGTVWHNVEEFVTIPETGIYTFWFKHTSGGNCNSSFDNIKLTSNTDLRIDAVEDQPYFGERVCPPVTVRNEVGTLLTEGVDYEVMYGKNDWSGRGIGYVAVVGKGGHYGVCGRNFHIGKPVYVTPDGTSEGLGTNGWANAVDFATALQKVAAWSGSPYEIWVAGSNTMTVAAVERDLQKNVVIRGGFAGDETVPEDRAEGAVSWLDGDHLYEIARLKNRSAVKFERFRFVNAPVRAITKTGFNGRLEFRDCEFRGNGENAGGAISFTGWRYDAANVPTTVLRCERCVFADNASYGNASVDGGAIYANTAVLEIEDSHFVNNGASGADAYRKGSAIYATLTPVDIRRTEFRGNLGKSGTGIVQLDGAATGHRFRNCLFINNEGMSSALLVSPDSFTRKTEIVNCTFAYNTGCASGNAAGLQASVGTIRVWNSIFYGNTNGEENNAADLRGGASSILDVGYTLFGEDSAASYYLNNGASLSDGTCYFADPLFVSESDAHLLSEQGYFDATGGLHKAEMDVRSPAIDAGDPTFECLNEPMPNGDIVNLGAYGDTEYASLTPVADPEITSLEVSWDGVYTQPTVTFTTGGTGSYGADVTIYISTDGGTTWSFVSPAIGGIQKGMTKSYLVPAFFPADSKIWVKGEIHGAGKKVATEPQAFDVEGELPPWYGKKGPANVIHVRPGATGDNDGTSWTDAFSSWADALAALTEEKNEIWLAGTNYITAVMGTTSVDFPLVIRGGFRGWETTCSERPEGLRSVLDGAKTFDLLIVNNTKELLIEDIEFVRGANRGFKKTTSAGDITITNCVFYGNSQGGGKWEVQGDVNNNYYNGGGGASLYGSGSAKAKVVDCRFEANISTAGGTCGYGGGLFVGSFGGGADIVRCAFVTNYMSQGFDSSAGAMAGMHIYNTRATVEGCSFHGHRANGTADVRGSCSGSVFRNCSFAGNYSGSEGDLQINLANASDTALVENCTFAYNLRVPSLNCRKGAVTVRNSIFYGNITTTTDTNAADIRLAADATADVDYCLFAVPEEEGSKYCVSETTADTLTIGTHCIYGDPLFVTSDATFRTQINAVADTVMPRVRPSKETTPSYEARAAYDVHLRGKVGYFDEKTGKLMKFRGETSPAIDAGDPESDCSKEPDLDFIGTHGGRVNLGAYGNTPWATMTQLKGNVLRVR